MAIYRADGSLLPDTDRVPKQTVDVLVASSEAPSEMKANAEYVCTGTNDELIIQQAVTYVANQGGGKVRLSEGRFYIDSFPSTDSAGDYVAVMIPQTGTAYSIELLGASLTYGSSKTSVERGTKIMVSDTCYEGLSSSSRYTILRGGYVASPVWQHTTHHLTLKDMEMQLPWNQKPITCVDLFYTNRALIERTQFRAYRNGYDGHSVTGTASLDVAVENCVGMRATSGSNNGILNDYRNMLAYGFYEGFKFAGEHVIGINLATIGCVYGYTFGNYAYHGNSVHPMTFINCCDERGINLPLFAKNGYYSSYNGNQAITFIDFNIERDASYAPGGVLGDLAKETTAGTFKGTINYTIEGHNGNMQENRTDKYFWESGSGQGFVSRNDAQALSGSSATRRAYAPNYLQQFYDTTVGKMLWCIDTANKTWVDADGNTVS